MNFLAQGDFSIPFQWFYYWTKHFYMWSFQSGTPNPDGLIRLPGRILNFIAFGLMGNMGASYFYILFSFVVAFVSFYVFAKTILQIKSRATIFLAALFFMLNPIFLGNVAKVGLVFAAALLPLCLVMIYKTFTSGKTRYLLILVLLLNLSFIHPYTFAVNTGVSFAYFIYLCLKNRQFAVKNIWRFVGIGVVGILLNAYFILPMVTMGTVSKDAISNSVTPTSADYTALVDVSNTGSLFTGFALAKNVFKDFEFYNSSYRNVFYFAVFSFYTLILGTYILLEKRYVRKEKLRIFTFLSFFIVLLALATVTVFKLDVIIKMLITLPGGWAFRSPLKWQLYIPFALASVLAIVCSRVKNSYRKPLLGAFFISILLMNGYLAFDVANKILTPRKLDHFSSLQDRDMNLKTILFINTNHCTDYMRANPRIVTEMNQVLNSKNIQVKHVSEQDSSSININSYDYVLDCYAQDNTTAMLTGDYDFRQVDQFVGGIFKLYDNQNSRMHVFSPEQVYKLDKDSQPADAYVFASKNLTKSFSYVENSSSSPASGLQDIFGNIATHTLGSGLITTSVSAGAGEHLLYSQSNSPVYYAIKGDTISLSPTQEDGMVPLRKDAPASLPAARNYEISYKDKSYDFKNLVKNGSLDDGLWDSRVSDCYNYDANPDIGMSLTKGKDNAKSLELRATRHVACTGPKQIAVNAGQHYLVGFDYQSLKGKYAGFMVRFDDKKKSNITERLQEFGNDWHRAGRDVVVPAGATHMRIMLLAYPDGLTSTSTSVVAYDNVYVAHIPPIQGLFYLTNKAKLLEVPKVSFSVVDPTKKVIQISNARGPFYIATSESYNKQWTLNILQANFAGPFDKVANVGAKDHVALNGTMNGWYVDPISLCKTRANECTRSSSGEYSFSLIMQYDGQQTFYIGAIISALTLFTCVTYFVLLRYKRQWLVRHKLVGGKND